MIKFLNNIYWFFSRFVNKDEKRLYKILRSRNINTHKLLELCQKDFMMVCVFLEYFTKGYVGLKKSKRAMIYRSMRQLEFDLLEFRKNKGFKLESRQEFFDMLLLFLHKSGRYTYQESTFLGGMTDPNNLIGDCNQIVSLYVHLWRLFFDIRELEIKLPPNHIVLSFRGSDIEATNGMRTLKFADLRTLEILELLTVNILDVSDAREKQSTIHPERIMHGFKLANSLSSHMDVVRKNLVIAKNNLAYNYLKNNKFKFAIKLFSETKNTKGLNSARNNACVYFVSKKKFVKALKFAFNQKLQTYVFSHWVEDDCQKHKFARALKNANRVQMQDYVMGKEYNFLASKLPSTLDSNSVKKHMKKLKRMLKLAQMMNDKKLTKQLKQILK